ncbi:TPA: hypothetical protein DCZ15_02060 [Candidatus Falkowbacteria bacterium]|nr:MAG: hypothetical protein UV95_C0001G0194 [Candidatus Falkowbacteria bacterium GW2011_GWF2_43_32]HBA36639.1 hypothetical protein [Candidatus Falkowbacteria bacterium]
MDTNKSKRILEQSYADLLPEISDYIVTNDDRFRALELSRLLSRAIDRNINELRAQPKLLRFYQSEVLKLKFVCLPALGDKEVIGLIKDNFCFQFKLEDYNILAKIVDKILSILVIDDRNVFKEELKKALLENNEIITADYEIKYVKDWVKNYVSKVGLDKVDNLIKAQYLGSFKGNKDISPEDYKKLMTLFNIYDFLNLPSDLPEGFDEEPPIKIDGKLYIFRKGVLDPVLENKKIAAAKALLEETTPQSISAFNQQFLASQTDSVSPLIQLETSLKNYPPSSLEYKAIKQEISRLKAAELKQAQKSDVKK